ncbi:MAG TPA: hypothetical protein VN643_19340 [Pyrinomonadaceae bacterium]|nr:hypothetical protein [Pyrinomonadaceae bacterium]
MNAAIKGRMQWEKKGLIFGPSGESSWARNSALQPTPYLNKKLNLIRVFVGLRDDEGVSRVGFVDVAADDPSRVLKVSQTPALDVGRPGAFDENGVVPCAAVERDGKLFLFYAGYQLGRKVKFFVFSGLAISEDGGESFQRYSQVPVCDRTDDEVFFRVIHTMMFDEGKWKAWYGGGSEFDVDNGHQYPRYNIRYAESPDGIHLNEEFEICIDMTAGEYRVGRPYVIKRDGRYCMFYGAGTKEAGYRLAYAESADGHNWTRKDSELGIAVSEAGWDSRMQAYPAIVSTGAQTYMFYNGNDYGREGFGYAVLKD